MTRQVFQRVTEFVRREGQTAVPAAIRAARHAGKTFLRKFPEEYARERKKNR